MPSSAAVRKASLLRPRLGNTIIWGGVGGAAQLHRPRAQDPRPQSRPAQRGRSHHMGLHTEEDSHSGGKFSSKPSLSTGTAPLFCGEKAQEHSGLSDTGRGHCCSPHGGGCGAQSLPGTRDVIKAQRKHLKETQQPVLVGPGVGLPRQAPGGPRGPPVVPGSSRGPAGPHWALPRGRSLRPTQALGQQVCSEVASHGRQCQGPKAGPDLGPSPLAVASQLLPSSVLLGAAPLRTTGAQPH